MSAATTAAVASANAANAVRLRKQCEELTETFNPTYATTQQKQDYAACINRLHPSEGDQSALAALFLISIAAGAIFAAIRGVDSFGRGVSVFEESAMGFLFGFLVSAVVLSLGAGLVVSALHLISRFQG